MSPRDKPVVWLRGEVKTPPFGPDARIEAGFLLRRLQRGELLGLHTRDRCRALAPVVTSCESSMPR